jgi:transcriptional antiterminator RfaH
MTNAKAGMESTQLQEPTAWFCVVSRRKHEYIAAAQLAERQTVRVFAPRIRFRRATRNGPRWTTEALFPCYFFAKMGPSLLRWVHHAPQVRGVVHFGNAWPTVPDQTMEELEKTLGGGQIHVIEPAVSSGDEVKIVSGTFHGFEAVVAQVMPGRERVAVLLEFLGRQTAVELDTRAILKKAEQRELLFKAA